MWTHSLVNNGLWTCDSNDDHRRSWAFHLSSIDDADDDDDDERMHHCVVQMNIWCVDSSKFRPHIYWRQQTNGKYDHDTTVLFESQFQLLDTSDKFIQRQSPNTWTQQQQKKRTKWNIYIGDLSYVCCLQWAWSHHRSRSHHHAHHMSVYKKISIHLMLIDLLRIRRCRIVNRLHHIANIK